MLFFVVVALVLLQRPAQGHRPGDEQQVGGHDHHPHGDEEQPQGRQGVLDGDGDVIGAPQQHQAAQGQEIVGFGGLLPHGFTAQQGDGIGPAQLPQAVQVQQGEDDPEEQQAVAQGVQVDEQAVARLPAHQAQEQQFRELAQGDAPCQPQDQGQDGDHHRLHQQEYTQVPLTQTQDIVQAELHLPAAHEEGVGVKEKDHGEQADDEHAHTQAALHRGAPSDGVQLGQVPQVAHDVAHQHHPGAGEEIGEIEAAVFPKTAQSQLGIEPHACSPPVESTVRVSAIF